MFASSLTSGELFSFEEVTMKNSIKAAHSLPGMSVSQVQFEGLTAHPCVIGAPQAQIIRRVAKAKLLQRLKVFRR